MFPVIAELTAFFRRTDTPGSNDHRQPTTETVPDRVSASDSTSAMNVCTVRWQRIHQPELEGDTVEDDIELFRVFGLISSMIQISGVCR